MAVKGKSSYSPHAAEKEAKQWQRAIGNSNNEEDKKEIIPAYTNQITGRKTTQNTTSNASSDRSQQKHTSSDKDNHYYNRLYAASSFPCDAKDHQA